MVLSIASRGAPPHRDTPKVAGVTGGGGIITAGGMAPKGVGVGKTHPGGGGAGKAGTGYGGSLGRKGWLYRVKPQKGPRLFLYQVFMMRLWGFEVWR